MSAKDCLRPSKPRLNQQCIECSWYCTKAALSYNWCRDASCSPPAVYDFTWPQCRFVISCEDVWDEFGQQFTYEDVLDIGGWTPWISFADLGIRIPTTSRREPAFPIILLGSVPVREVCLASKSRQLSSASVLPSSLWTQNGKMGWPIFLNSHNYQERSFLLKSCEGRRDWARCMRWHLRWLHLRCCSKDKVSWKNER